MACALAAVPTGGFSTDPPPPPPVPVRLAQVRLRPAGVAHQLDRLLKAPSPVAGGAGTMAWAGAGASLELALARALFAQAPEAWDEWAHFGPPGDRDALAEFWASQNDDAEAILSRLTRRRPRASLRCSNPSSMVSSVWGFSALTLAGRGYFYTWPDEEGSRWGHGLLASWAPAHDVAAYGAALAATYARHAEDLGFPPFGGEAVNGPAAPLREGIARVLARDPAAWQDVLETLRGEPDRKVPGLHALVAASGAARDAARQLVKRTTGDARYPLMAAEAAALDPRLRAVLLELYWAAIADPTL
jgi:hypothetical protein